MYTYKIMPPGRVQVAGFSNVDTHLDVITKGARGLGVDITPRRLSLLVSSGLVLDTPLPDGEEWMLGGYVDVIGGPQVRGKRTFGIVVPLEDDEEEEEDDGEEKTTRDKVMYKSVCMQ